MQYVPNYENKVQYIVDLIKDKNDINILELGVREGISTKQFLEVCKKNNGNLISVDIEDCGKVSNDSNWRFIHSRDDNFELIDNNEERDNTKRRIVKLNKHKQSIIMR